MGMIWLDRDGSNKIITLYANEQFSGQDKLDEGHPDILTFLSRPTPTNSDLIDQAFPQSGVGRVLFEILFELINRVITLENGTVVTKAQFKTFLVNKIP